MYRLLMKVLHPYLDRMNPQLIIAVKATKVTLPIPTTTLAISRKLRTFVRKLKPPNAYIRLRRSAIVENANKGGERRWLVNPL